MKKMDVLLLTFQVQNHLTSLIAHWFDSTNNIIGVTFSYADKLDLGFGDRSTFSVSADGHTDLTGYQNLVNQVTIGNDSSVKNKERKKI
jgi:hypothetical protein